MTARTSPRPLEWPEVIPLTDEERAEFHSSCTAMVAKGGEVGEIAGDMLRISNKLTELKQRVVNFLEARGVR